MTEFTFGYIWGAAAGALFGWFFAAVTQGRESHDDEIGCGAVAKEEQRLLRAGTQKAR